MTISRLVCSGGGAKGVIYAGAYDALTTTGVIHKITEVAGASAGAMSAALIAVGMPVAEFRRVLCETNLKSLMGERVPGALITKDGAPLLALIRREITATVVGFLNGQGDSISDELNRMKVNLSSEPAGAFTFRDLEALREAFPTSFKKLTVNAVMYPDGALQLFNVDLTPNVDIALACRASASIPIVLQPTKIQMNAVDQTFVDGGLYDNLPSDYFDKNIADGSFSENKKKDETLILAFGEGLDDNKNPVFQALKGDLIPDAFLELLLDKAKFDPAQGSVIHQINSLLTFYVTNKTITHKEADSIRDAVNQLDRENIESRPVATLRDQIKDKLKPALYYASYFEQFKRNTLVAWFGGFNATYRNTERKEMGFQKLRTDYPNQTIELRVGTVKTTDFDKAEKIAREMSTMGYLDTMDYQFGHHLTTINSDDFYASLLDKFMRIHTAILLATKKDPLTDELLNKMDEYRQKELSPGYTVLNLIKPRAEKNMNSVHAFGLSRAVEWHTGTLCEKALLIETHAMAKRQQWVSRTNFKPEDGDTLISQFKLFTPRSQENGRPKKRSEIIAEALFYKCGDTPGDPLVSLGMTVL